MQIRTLAAGVGALAAAVLFLDVRSSSAQQIYGVPGSPAATTTIKGDQLPAPVNDADYQVPFRFTGKLDKLTLTIDRPKLSPEDEKKLMEAERNNHMSE